MFTYTLSGKTIENGKNRITVDYTNGTVKCNETFFFSSKQELDDRITNKIEELEKVVALDVSIVTDGYIKENKKTDEPVPLTALQEAEAELYRLKNLIELGVVKETDQEFIDAVTSYKIQLNSK